VRLRRIMPELAKNRARMLERTLRRVAGRSRMLKQSYHWLVHRCRRIPQRILGSRARFQGEDSWEVVVKPESIIWIFGSGRSGSTWLRSMMEELDRYQTWEEPMVGRLFGEFHGRAQEVDLERPSFIMANATQKGWKRAIRNFVLDCASYAHPRMGVGDYLVVKEPNGSTGAPLLMEALPESRMILLVRDPRDVVSSMLDAAQQGGWLYERKESEDWKQKALPDKNPDTFVKNRSQKYVQHTGSAKKAYDAHRGPKVLVRYEELRADTLETMKRIYTTLGIPVNEEDLARAVEKHSWESIPEVEKGGGKFYRKATPGGWKEDLTPEQTETVERVTASLLEEFYPPS
jgi:Sulfotransferase family